MRITRRLLGPLTILLLCWDAQSFGAQKQLFVPIDFSSPASKIHVSVEGTWRDKNAIFSRLTPASPPVYDSRTHRLFLGSRDRQAIDVIEISIPSAPKKVYEINLRPFGGEPKSLSLKNGILAVIVGNAKSSTLTKLVLFNVRGKLIAQPIELPHASDIAFAPNGLRLVATISPSPTSPVDIPESAVAVIELSAKNLRHCAFKSTGCSIETSVKIADFTSFNGRKDELIAAGVRLIFPKVDPRIKVSQDLNPSSLTISRNSATAWVSLQQNNAVAIVDLVEPKVRQIVPFGAKDHSISGNGFDASDDDNAINIDTWPVKSFYQPKAIAVVRYGDDEVLVTANGGDPRDLSTFFSDGDIVKNLTLDSSAFPNASSLKEDKNIGNLRVSRLDGDADNDKDFDELFMFGARSFATWTADINLLFESKDDFEQITSYAVPECFNCPEDTNSLDARSPIRGPEPEVLAVGRVGLRQLAFVAFERLGGIMAYDITDPSSAQFQQYINNRNFAVNPSDVCGEKGKPQLPDCINAGDLEPEGMLFIPRIESPINAPLVVVTHELSDSTTIFRVDLRSRPCGGKESSSCVGGER